MDRATNRVTSTTLPLTMAAGSVFAGPAQGSTAVAPTARSSVGVDLGFHAHLHEPNSGLVLARARVLDPVSGQYLSRDPEMFRDSVNLYAFVAGDPINNRDPTGQLTVRLTAEDGIDVPQLRLLRGTLKRLVESGGGSLPVTQLLSILSFPPEVDERIRKARGDVVVTAQRKPAASPSPKSASARDVSTGGMTTLKGHFRNKGAEIAESIPGVPAGIELSIDVAGNITINLENKVIDLDKLVGISAEIPGPNISIDRITLGPDWLEFEF